jgi:hypothetical protein
MATTDLLIQDSDVGCFPLVEGEYPMTFQIALIGTDGLLVGSDRLMTYQTVAPENLATQRSETTKFVKSADNSIVCFFAGSHYAVNLAQVIASSNFVGNSPLQWAMHLRQVATGLQRPPLPVIDEILVARTDMPSFVSVVTKTNQPMAQAATVERWLCTGDNSPARFLPWHLYRRMTVAELKPLALLTLAYASKESPGLVGIGFDLVIVRNGRTVEEERYGAREILEGNLVSVFDKGLQGAWQDAIKQAVRQSSKRDL